MSHHAFMCWRRGARLLVLTAWAGGAAADGVSLAVGKGGAPGESVVAWTGGSPAYEVFRSSQPGDLYTPTRRIATVSASPYSAAGDPPAGGGYFYAVSDARHLTLGRTGSGGVTRDGAPACAAACPETTEHANGSTVTLVAAPVNGGGYYFTGWSGDCSGPARQCNLAMTQSRAATANFSPIDHNLAFVSSATAQTNLGSAAQYDVLCNSLATAAGLGGASGSAWIAWVSDPASNARTRLGAARGWLRVDGRPVADDPAALFSNNVIHHPIRLDEYGVDAGAAPVMTGTTSAGATGSHCNGWAGSGTMTIGNAASGPGGWTFAGTAGCAAPMRIYCLMNTLSAAVTLVSEPGKRIYLSGPVNPTLGIASFDAQCTADKPPGTGTVKALVATTTASAQSRLAPGQRYVRPDGIFVASTAELGAGVLLSSGIWQTGAGAYLANYPVWTGAATPASIGTAATTCANWSDSLTSGIIGNDTSTAAPWWNYIAGQPCNLASGRCYCVEQ